MLVINGCCCVVTDARRLEAVVPTIEYLAGHGAKVIILSHHSKEGTSLKPVAWALGELINKDVGFIADAISHEALTDVENMMPGDVAVCENLRFHPEEEANDAEFAKKLAALGDVYVDDDFTTMHREHASIVGIPKYLPAVAGFLVEKEVTTILDALENPTRPLMAIVGGAKISTKIEILDNLLPKVNAIFVGGAMANTFLAANGEPVGKSLLEQDEESLARRIEKEAKGKGIDLFLPIDVVVTDDLEKTDNVRTLDVSDVSEADIIVDVGPKSIEQLGKILDQKGTVIWNGPVGITETPQFAKGSLALAHAVIDSGVFSLVGGGDTAGFVDQAKLASKFSFVSTGGGASLELMSGKPLPGVEVLEDK
jgi:phosphoglycerate kinase